MKNLKLRIRVLSLSAVLLLCSGMASAATDGFYSLGEVASSWESVGGDRLLPETTGSYQFAYGDEEVVSFVLPWAFNYYGVSYWVISADTNGNIWFADLNRTQILDSFPLSSTGPVVAAWNNDLTSYYQGGVFVKNLGNRVVVRWVTEALAGAATGLVSEFEVVLYQSGDIQFNYADFGTTSTSDFGSGMSRGNSISFLSITDTFAAVPTLGQRSFLFTAQYNPAIADTDGDGSVDSIDTDDDDDGVNDTEDVFPLDASEWSDFDSDNLGDNSDLDGDDDGMDNVWEQTYGLNPFDTSDAGTDLDGDGLTNLEEHDYGVDPLSSDTDADKMPDGWEVSYGFDPTSSADAFEDYDGDRLLNWLEYEMGTDPLNQDTDLDGLSDYVEYIQARIMPAINVILLE